MSLLGLVAFISCFFGGAGSIDLPAHACAAQSILSTDASSPHQAVLPGKLPARPQTRPQANDSDNDGDDGSSSEDLTASLDDDYYHITALVWERLIVAATAALLTGNQWVTLESAAPHGLACEVDFSPALNSLRSLHVCLQI